MRRSLFVLLALLAWPGSAVAAPVLFRAGNGAVSTRNDPYVTGPALTPAPAATGHKSTGRSSAGQFTAALARTHATRKKPRTVFGELTRIYHQHGISAAAYHGYELSYGRALTTERHLHGTRRAELTAVTANVHDMAVAGALTPSRLPVIFQTVDRNRQWWTTGPLLANAQRVEFAGSQLVWQYYAGQGIQLQVLGSFGKADGLYTSGLRGYPALKQLLAQLIPLAAQRGGGLTWEYYFHFDGGAPPWTSAMSQATGLEALSRAYRATGNAYYLQVGQRALPVFSARPPAGVSVATPRGTRFLQYTFTPGTSIINAFLQTLIGLHDYAVISKSAQAAKLFKAGNAEAQAEVPHFDTGAWSLYQPGIEDDLSYHELVTGFLAQMCTITRTPVYCSTAQRFRAYLKTPPVLTQLTRRGKVRRSTALRFSLSKFSHIGVVLTRGTTAVYSTSAYLPYGTDQIKLPAEKAGRYGLRIAATDLAGNFARLTGTLTISR
ncbi:MAG TPA: D-glucuronyl C5-epimerase family protein [Solirubrobacteraceae bacterium]